MALSYTYKQQGNGSDEFPFKDSWTCVETDDKGVVVTKYMVYEDPNIIAKSELVQMFLKATPQEIAEIKLLLK